MSSLSLYQPTISRNAVGRSLFRGTRSGTPAPDHSPRPNHYPPRVWRPPRSKPGTRHDYVPPFVQETQHQLPWRAERQRQRRKESSIPSHGTRRDEVGRINPRPTGTSVEQPASSYPYQPSFTEHRRYPRVPRERIRYPERRPSRTQHVSPSAQEDNWREPPSGHRASEQQGYWVHPTYFSDIPRHDHDRDRSRHIPRRKRYSTSFDPSYNPPISPYDNVLPTSSHAGSKRWSWSSDSSSSSTNSAISWSSSSSTLCSSSMVPQEVRPNPHESDIRFRHPKTSSHWSRSRDVETINGWKEDDYFIPSGDLSVVDNDEYVRSPSTDHYSGEDGDLGQTVVYTDCGIIARDQRIADPHQHARAFDGISVVQLPREAARRLDPSSSSDDDRGGRSRRVENRETRRRKRPYLLPIWPEHPPRGMNNLRRVEGIRYRYPRDSDDTPESENVSPEFPYNMDDDMRSFLSRRNKPQRQRQETIRQHNPSN